MNDEFMHQLYEAPRAEFAEAVYQRIFQQSQPRFTQMIGQKLTFRTSVIAFALLFLVAACVYVVTDRGWRKVGGIWVDVERTQKVDFVPSLAVTEQPQAQPTRPECLPVEEAKKMLHFEVRVPTWAPEGFTSDNKVCPWENVNLSDGASMSWQRGTEPAIGLMLSNLRWFNMATQKYEVGPPSIWWSVGPGSYKEVQVHGHPAVLVRGDWDLYGIVSEVPPGRKLDANRQLDAKWDKKLGLHLYWVDGETMYELSASPRIKISVEDLIKMAESTR
jgi:hypothetical protein